MRIFIKGLYSEQLLNLLKLSCIIFVTLKTKLWDLAVYSFTIFVLINSGCAVEGIYSRPSNINRILCHT